MVKSYQRFEPVNRFGVIASNGANTLYWNDYQAGRRHSQRAISPALENVHIWKLKSGELLSTLRDPENEATVTFLKRSTADKSVLAAGYSDGSVRVWDLNTAELKVTLNGHSSSVTSLEFDSSGARMISGSQDTTIIVWDLIAETGLYRLKSHRDQITGLIYLPTPSDGADPGWLVSCSRDSLVKLWDLGTQHCIETHADHRGAIWAIEADREYDTLWTAGAEPEIRAWSLDSAGLTKDSLADSTMQRIELRGSFPRMSKERPFSLVLHPRKNMLACQCSDRQIELFTISDKADLDKIVARRKKRRSAKGGPGETSEESLLETKDYYPQYVSIRTPGKIRSVDWGFGVDEMSKSENVQLLVSQSNNCVDLYSVSPPIEKGGSPDYERSLALELQGHRSDIRTILFTEDEELLASGSNGSLKLWNVQSGLCIRTFDCGYSLSSSFLLGGRYIVLGYKSGELQMFEVASATPCESFAAHESSVWSMHLHPDGQALVTASADKSVKFWDVRLVLEQIPGTARSRQVPALKHARTLKLNDEALCVRYSPDGRLVAVSLLDTTVKVFYNDSLKFYLSLYGHKLPVLSMDIAHDSKLLATCSADKNVKLWGLDFGDCHKSIFAHQDSIMQVEFLSQSHNFVTASKDGLVKLWDGDKFEQISKLTGFHGEVWALAVGQRTNKIAAASHDKSIRIWEEGDDLVFLEEEREKEQEDLYDSNLVESFIRDGQDQDEMEVDEAGKQTKGTLMAGERLIEALQIGSEDLATMKDYHERKQHTPSLAAPRRHPVFTVMQDSTAEKYVLNTIEKIKASQLSDALMVLSFDNILRLLDFINIWAIRQWNIPLVCRIVHFVIRFHHSQITANRIMREKLNSVQKNLQSALRKHKDAIGYNMAALKYIQREAKSTHVSDFETDMDGPSDSGKKRVFTSVA